jgi:hypothetical protein
VLISYYGPVFGKGVAKEFLELTEKNKKVDGISTCELNQSHEYYIRPNFGLPTFGYRVRFYTRIPPPCAFIYIGERLIYPQKAVMNDYAFYTERPLNDI